MRTRCRWFPNAEPVTTTTAVTETTVETPDTTVPLPEFPEQRTDLVHGAPTWAVVLAGAANPEDPAILTAEQAATDAGYNTGWTDCDEGAAEALGMQAGIITLSVYFETEEDAEMAAEAFAIIAEDKRATRSSGPHVVGGYLDGGDVILYAGTNDDLVSVSVSSAEFDSLRRALAR